MRADSLPHRIWKEIKQQPGTAGPSNMLGCCLIYFHFRWGKLSTLTVLTNHINDFYQRLRETERQNVPYPISDSIIFLIGIGEICLTSKSSILITQGEQKRDYDRERIESCSRFIHPSIHLQIHLSLLKGIGPPSATFPLFSPILPRIPVSIICARKSGQIGARDWKSKAGKGRGQDRRISSISWDSRW